MAHSCSLEKGFAMGVWSRGVALAVLFVLIMVTSFVPMRGDGVSLDAMQNVKIFKSDIPIIREPMVNDSVSTAEERVDEYSDVYDEANDNEYDDASADEYYDAFVGEGDDMYAGEYDDAYEGVESEYSTFEDSGPKIVDANVDGKWIPGSYFVLAGVHFDEGSGFSYTYYSQRVLPGGGLTIPGRHVNEEGYVVDINECLCLASDDLPYGTIVKVPFGTGLAVVYDCGGGFGNLDVYVDW